jgi:hypothetical protein
MTDQENVIDNCNLQQFQRNRYFYGKLMSVRDFETEQGYMNEKRHLLNRLVNGAGIVCGLDGVTVGDDQGKIKVTFETGGAALDNFGREIVIPGGSEKEVFIGGTGPSPVNLKTTGTGTFYLYLVYEPRDYEPVSSAANPSGCEETCCPNRVLEDFRIIASATAPAGQTVVCPDLSGIQAGDADAGDRARETIGDWFKGEITAPCPGCNDTGVFILVLLIADGNVSIDSENTSKHLSLVHNTRLLSRLLTCHLTDFGNPHKTGHWQINDVLPIFGDEDDETRNKHISNNDASKWNEAAEEPGGIKSIAGVENEGGDVELAQAGSIEITPDNENKRITIGESHSPRTDNPHETTAEQVGALSTAGGYVTGPVHIKTTEWSALTANATRTHGVMGRLTEDPETGVDYQTAGVVGVSEIPGQHGVYAKAPEGSHALYVEGTALFTGAKTGYVVDIFKNAGAKTLKTGDVVKLEGTPISRFRGDNRKIPVTGVTLVDKENDNRTIGIVDRKAIPDKQEETREKPGASTAIKKGKELYVVTLGTYAHCSVDASKAPIAVGDLLTSSGTPGHAQKAVEPRIGTIIGKALEPLEKGTGSIAVFVNIQ